MLSSNKMTDDQRINMIRMSNPPTAVALCTQNEKKKKSILSLWLKLGCLCLFRKFFGSNRQKNSESRLTELTGASGTKEESSGIVFLNSKQRPRGSLLASKS